ncbi:MAG: MogA/MoaB family molybdenum cofactor biosynthesis protein [Spirochaetaceae bacterium]|nr:MogA/MoaB family molybdenum cofactor biosynthesis protein [Spirochaetaceae bacterium]
MKVVVITVSDRASRGEYEDLSGPEIRRILSGHFADELECRAEIVPDEEDEILKALDRAAAGDNPADAIITTGGTGIGPRDLTPDISRTWCDKELPGIAEMLRAESYKETTSAVLSRGYAGLKGRTLLINFPGSVNAVKLCTRLILPVLNHAPAMLSGGGH